MSEELREMLENESLNIQQVIATPSLGQVQGHFVPSFILHARHARVGRREYRLLASRGCRVVEWQEQQYSEEKTRGKEQYYCHC